jgi:hypothetical protein
MKVVMIKQREVLEVTWKSAAFKLTETLVTGLYFPTNININWNSKIGFCVYCGR